MLESETLVGAGVVAAAASPVGTTVAEIVNPGRGRYLVWGTARHFMDDGCRLRVGTSIVIPLICNSAGKSEAFGPISVDIVNSATSIVVELIVPSGGPNSVSATVYARNLTKPKNS